MHTPAPMNMRPDAGHQVRWGLRLKTSASEIHVLTLKAFKANAGASVVLFTVALKDFRAAGGTLVLRV